MSAAIALIFLAEAAATCAPVDTNRLRAGASVVQAIVTIQPKSSMQLAPTPAATDGYEFGPTASTDEPETAEPVDQCKVPPTPIA
jgi:hypothetical protein